MVGSAERHNNTLAPKVVKENESVADSCRSEINQRGCRFSFISIVAHFQAEFIFNLVLPQLRCRDMNLVI
jgi:hypothetical protein